MENYTVEEYEAQLAAMKDGSLVVDANYPVDENNIDVYKRQVLRRAAFLRGLRECALGCEISL